MLSKFFTSSFRLSAQGVLGMNARNIDYIGRYNAREKYSLVDNKLLTKKAAQTAGIKVPELLGVIERQSQLAGLNTLLNPLDSFVIKPTRGSGGKGIFVVTENKYPQFFKPNGKCFALSDLRRHTNNILSGLYSLGGKPDQAMIEALIRFDPVFADYTYEGVPDIRIIVFRGFPIMAMLRCATHRSDGRANLHQGAIGVGLCLQSGHSLFAIKHNLPIQRHPDTDKPFADLTIPRWEEVLSLAAGCYEMTGLGYLGCDIVLDQQRGPVILELNARPGLTIQLATGDGLKHRLHHIEQLSLDALEIPITDRVAYCRQHFH